MTTYTSLDEFVQEKEQQMEYLEQNKDYFFTVYDKIHQHIDYCLQTKDYDSLFQLIGYFKKSAKQPQLHQTAETRRVLILLELLSLELNNNKVPFVSSTADFESFMEQYTLTVFALRRLELSLDDTLMSEAINYLNSIPLSIYSVITLIRNEYFENYERLLLILSNHIDTWSITDKIQLLESPLLESPSQRILSELASLYLELNIPDKAYSYLCAIPSPNEEVTELMNLLKEKIENELS